MAAHRGEDERVFGGLSEENGNGGVDENFRLGLKESKEGDEVSLGEVEEEGRRIEVRLRKDRSSLSSCDRSFDPLKAGRVKDASLRMEMRLVES